MQSAAATDTRRASKSLSVISVQPQPRPRQVEIAIGARLYASTRPRMQVRNQIRDFAFDNSDDNELTPFVLLITPAPAG